MVFSEELHKIMRFGELFSDAVDENNILFLYMLNDVRFNEAMNSIASLRTYGGHTNVLIFALDTLVCPHVSKLNLGIPCVWTGVDLPESAPWYGESDLMKHWKLTMLALRKFVYIALALAWSYSAFFVDTDTVFLQDPYVELTGDYDLWIQDGSRGCREVSETCRDLFGSYSRTCNASWEYNTGFMFWKSSQRSRRFMLQFLHEIDGVFTHGRFAHIYDDQTILSFYIHHGSWVDMKLKVKVLPRLKYPHGNLFFDMRLCTEKSQAAWEERCCDVVMVHNNFLMDPNGDAKTRRLREHGLWYEVSDTVLGCCPRPPSSWRRLLAEPSGLPAPPMPYGLGSNGASTVLRATAGSSYVAFLDLLRALRAGHLVALELPGVGPPSRNAPEVAEFLYRSQRLPSELEVIVDKRAWLFLPTDRCHAVLSDWLLPEGDAVGDGFPPLGSLRARLRFPGMWWTVPQSDTTQLLAARACQEVPCW